MSIDNIMNKSNQKESFCCSNDLNDKNDININIKNQSIIEINDINEFKEKMGKINWEYKNQFPYLMKQDIKRVWYIMKNLRSILIIHNQGHSPLNFIKGKDSETVGNVFKGNLFGNFPFIGRVIKFKDYPELKKIEWLFHFRDKYYVIFKTEYFIVSNELSTSIITKMKFDKKEFYNEIKTYFKEPFVKLYEYLEKGLNNSPINLVMHESGLINGKMADIWDIITDFSKLSAIAPYNNFPPYFNLRNIELKKKQPFTINYKNLAIKCFIEITFRADEPGWSKWLIISNYYIENSEEKKLSTLFQLNKISNDLCQLNIYATFFKPINAENFQKISEKIRYSITSLQEYFDNFYSPNNQGEAK